MINKQINKLISVWLVLSMAWSPLMVMADVPVPSANFSPDDGGQTVIEVSPNGQRGFDMVIDQPNSFNTYNWDSFDIGKNDSVHFDQISDSASALNYIHQNGASQIFGQLTADGNIYLVNQNGIVFGETAQVDVGSLVASSLDIDEELLKNNGLFNSMSEEMPLFTAFVVKGPDPNNPSRVLLEVLDSGPVEVHAGAEIIASNEGRVILVAPVITNGGSIRTPGGQTILAAADVDPRVVSLDADTPEGDVETEIENLEKAHGVYLAASTDSDHRGLFVEVNTGGEVNNIGEIIAERGNITLLGMAINQEGVLRATTSVDVNGTIRLLARDQVSARDMGRDAISQQMLLWGSLTADDGELKFDGSELAYMAPTRTGSVTLGGSSVTEVVPDTETADKAVPDAQSQSKSVIDIMGKEVTFQSDGNGSGAQVTAKSGIVQVAAVENPRQRNPRIPTDNSGRFDGSEAKVVLEEGVKIDVSGTTDTVLDMSRNVLELDLRSNELRDSPLQRDGVLNGETVLVDLRGGVSSIDIADISGAIENTPRTLSERLAAGGDVNLISTGTVDINENATVDISGGEINFRAGFIQETRLVANTGQVVDISDASELVKYVAVLGENEVFNESWGVVESYDNFVLGNSGEFVNAYTQGASAGSFNVVADNYIPGGNLVADVHVGPYQRDAGNLPGGGTFDLNLALSNSGVTNIAIVALDEFKEKQLGNEAGDTVYLPDSFFSNTADSFKLSSNGRFDIHEGAVLRLDGGGSFGTRSYQETTIAGAIINPAGDVTIKADDALSPDDLLADINLSNTALIDTSGMWVNDNPLLSPSENQPNLISAGAITLDAFASINADPGIEGNQSQLLANGGAYRKSDGKIIAGTGGDIALIAGNFKDNPDSRLNVDTDSNGEIDIRMESFALAQGGSLSLTAREIQIGGAANESALNLSPETFSEGGFSSFNLTAGDTGLRIVGGGAEGELSEIQLATANYVLPNQDVVTVTGERVANIETGGKLSDFANLPVPAETHPTRRQNVNLSLTTLSGFIDGNDDLVIESDVVITAVPGSIISMKSAGSLNFAGKIENLGGEVSFELSDSSFGYDDGQAIRLYDTSLIDVSATAIEKIPDASGISQFKAYDAGTISLQATRGYILAENGATLKANGSIYETAIIGAYQSGLQQNVVEQQVALDAGTIRLQAAEGMLFEGNIEATQASETGAGGSLEVVLYSNARFSGTNESPAANSFNEYPLTVAIEDNSSSPGRVTNSLMESDQISVTIDDQANTDNGVAYLDLALIEKSGVDNLSLRAINSFGSIFGLQRVPTEVAAIRFDTASPLVIDNQLVLDSPTILVGDHEAQVISNYLAIGTETMLPAAIRTDGSGAAGDGSFNALANFIDLSGASEFEDAGSVSFISQNDVRLLGRTAEFFDSSVGEVIEIDQIELNAGSLTTYGDLNITASQIVPTTATGFSFNLPTSGSTFTTIGQGNDAPILSSLGKVNIEVENFIHGGVIKAPFGQIDIRSDNILLEPGSLLSVSGENLIVLFGEVLGDGQWVYTNRGENTSNELLVNELLDPSVTLTGDKVDFSEGATIDVSGGGDLLAYEFVPGLGGSTDYLAETDDSTTFAVLPGYGTATSGEWGAYDTIIGGNSKFLTGDTVYLEGVNGLPAGEYAMLPSRYALLPGAYLVTPQGAAGDTVSGLQSKQLDGADIVAGKYGQAGVDTQDDLWTPFVVESGQVALQQSQYNLNLASEHFNTVDNIGRVGLPQDAGRLSLIAESELNLAGNINALADEGGIGGSLDISGSMLEVVSVISEGTDTVQLLDSELNELDVESILLGGTRSKMANGIEIDVTAQEVKIGEGTALTLPELLLVAEDQVSVKSSASVSSRQGNVGNGGRAEITGDGAFLQVSDGGIFNVVRSDVVGTSGDLLVEQGASLTATNSLALEASRQHQVEGEIKTPGVLNLTARSITIAEAGSPSEAEVNLTAEILEETGASGFLLKSREVLTLAGDISLNTNTVTLDTPLIAGELNQVGSNQVVISAKDRFTLANSDAGESQPVIAGEGLLTLRSNNFQLEGTESPSTIGLSGFSATNIGRYGDTTAATKVIAANDLRIINSGDMVIETDLLSAKTGANLEVQTSGDFVYTSELSAADAFQQGIDYIAANIELEASNVSLGGNIKLNAGALNIVSQNDVSLDESYIDVSGLVSVFGTQQVQQAGVDAGEVSLEAKTGNVIINEDAVIDLTSQFAESRSGSLLVTAREGTATFDGTLKVQGIDQDTGGSLIIDVGSLANAGSVLHELNGFENENSDPTGFTDKISLRLQQGNIELLGDAESIKAGNIDLQADGGSVIIDSVLNASGNSGGIIKVAATDEVLLTSNADLRAIGESENGSGGFVQIQNQYTTSDRGIVFEQGSKIDVSGNGENGSVDIVAAITGNDLKISDAGIAITGSENTRLLAYHREEQNTLTEAVIQSATGTFDAVFANSGVAGLQNAAFVLTPVLEVFNNDTIEIAEDIDLTDIRFGDNQVPLDLVIRSEAAIDVDSNIYSGIQWIKPYSISATPSDLAPIFSESGSITLVAGAEPDAADYCTLNATSFADITLAESVSIVSGTGDIDLHASGNIVLEDGASIKTIGYSDKAENIQDPRLPFLQIGLDEDSGIPLEFLPDTGSLYFSHLFQLFPFASNFSEGSVIFYGKDGGNINLNSGNDISGNGIDQISTAWRYRFNREVDLGFSKPFTKNVTTWGIDYANFTQGVGTLGGGDIHVSAAGKVENLLLAAPTVGKQIGDNPVDGGVASNEVLVTGGGDIRVQAGGDVNTMSYLVSDGELSVSAEGEIGVADEQEVSNIAAYGNADIDYTARGRVELGGAAPEFTIPISTAQSNRLTNNNLNEGKVSDFNIWLDKNASSSLTVSSNSDNVVANADFQKIIELYINAFTYIDGRQTKQIYSISGGSNESWAKMYTLLPQQLEIVSHSGDVDIENSVFLNASPDNSLAILAKNNIIFDANAGDRLVMVNNVNLKNIAGQETPINDFRLNVDSLYNRLSGLSASFGPLAPSLTGDGDLSLIAKTGNIESIGDGDVTIDFGKVGYIEAGHDIINPLIMMQNNSDDDVSRIIAGNDIRYPVTRNQDTGVLLKSEEKGIFARGSGTLLVQAGGDISMGASDGIRTTGNVSNSALPEVGADVYVLAGIKDKPAFDDFLVPIVFKNVDITTDDIRDAGIEASKIDSGEAQVPSYLTNLIDPGEVDTAGERAFINLEKSDQIQVASYLFDTANIAPAKDVYLYQALMNELRDAGREQLEIQAAIAKGEEGVTNEDFNGYSRGYAALDTLFPGSSEGTGKWDGDISLVFSTLQTEDGGDVNFFVPGGAVDVGLPTTLVEKQSADLGILARGVDSSIFGFADEGINVNQSRVFTLDGGDIMLWSSNGDIDAGKGAKTALSVPPAEVQIVETKDEDGNPVIVQTTVFPPAIDGSGIGSFFTPGNEPGDIDLFAPRGVIDAGDAGIRAGGDLNLGSDTILGADNIDVGGTAVGVPVSAGSSAAVSGLGGLTDAATDSATESATSGADSSEQSQTAFLTVEIIGLGE